MDEPFGFAIGRNEIIPAARRHCGTELQHALRERVPLMVVEEQTPVDSFVLQFALRLRDIDHNEGLATSAGCSAAAVLRWRRRVFRFKTPATSLVSMTLKSTTSSSQS